MVNAESYVPTHKDFRIEFRPGQYTSTLRTLKAFKAGELMTYLTGLTKGPKDYATIQNGVGPGEHVNFNSDLVYINHSCEPNVTFDLSSPNQAEWQLRALKDIHPGDELFFLYPSTEWDMEQPFDCFCGTATCLGMIKGAKYLSKSDLLARSHINPWILQLIDERDSKSENGHLVQGF